MSALWTCAQCTLLIHLACLLASIKLAKLLGLLENNPNIPDCMQVLVLSCERFIILPSLRTVKHLVVEQLPADLQPVLDGLRGLPLLQTLSLINSDNS